MFADGDDLRKHPLLERKRRLKAILPRHKLIAFSEHRKASGRKFFAEAERKHLEGILAKRADSPYGSGSRTGDWLKVKTAQRQEVVIAGFTAPRRTRPFFGALALALHIGHVGTGFSHQILEELHGKLMKLKAAKSPFPAKVKDEAVTTWVRPTLVAEVKFAEWTSKGELRQPVYLGLRNVHARYGVMAVLPQRRLEAQHLAEALPFGTVVGAPFVDCGQDGAGSGARIGPQDLLDARLKGTLLDDVTLAKCIE